MPQNAREIALLELVLHELRTPLSVAAGSLPQALPGSPGPAEKSAADRLSRAIERLTVLAGEMRAWTRAGDEFVSPTPVTVLVTELRGAEAAEQKRNVRLDAGRATAEGLVLAGPALGSSLQALARAVLRAAPSGTTVAVASHIDGRRTRIGIGEIDLESAGEDFPAEFAGGLGFSLPLARAVIEAAGGTVWSRSEDGRLAGIAVELRRA